MRLTSLIAHCALAYGLTNVFTLPAAELFSVSKPQKALTDAAADNNLLFVMFYKEPNTAADKMLNTVKGNSLVKNGQARWTSVRVTDPQERSVAEKFQVTRAPMPCLVAVHPNGAVTGVFPAKVSAEELAECAVSPKFAECLKLLQANRLVVVLVQTDPSEKVPAGVTAFKMDPHYAKRTSIITVAANDANEAKFLSGMELDPATITSPVTLLLAPPGGVVSKYAATASKNEIIESLAAAGKCCNDKNCKHNKKTTQQ